MTIAMILIFLFPTLVQTNEVIIQLSVEGESVNLRKRKLGKISVNEIRSTFLHFN